jgi:MFS transporter, PAT family, beta-lactamase induction signal transducer AmpG
VLQVAMAGLIMLLAGSNPAVNIGFVAVVALLISLLSPTHDLILDAWRIEVARSDEDKDLMSALYQFGYKSAGLITGFVALILAARIGWVAVYFMIGGFLLFSIIGSLLAPEPANSRTAADTRLSFLPDLPRAVALPAVVAVALGWLIAFSMIIGFVYEFLILKTGPKPSVFVSEQGPWIVALTVLMPALISALLIWRFKPGATETPLRLLGETKDAALQRTLFRAIFDPLMELISRLRWGAALVLLLALTYRFTDAVWGTFAYPFYLGTEFGALGHTLDEVGIASKFFGVVATIFGSFLGAVLIAVLGRMPVFFAGAVVAAATNLLYADLATGGHVLDGILTTTRLDVPLVAFAEWAAKLSPEAIAIDQGQRMARLMVTIFIENVAGGFALVAMTAYLTSVVNPRFAAVQYALLASLTMLLGTLGRTALGDLIEQHGYYWVFITTFWLGGVAVVLSIIEWLRQANDKTPATSLVLAQD